MFITHLANRLCSRRSSGETECVATKHDRCDPAISTGLEKHVPSGIQRTRHPNVSMLRDPDEIQRFVDDLRSEHGHRLCGSLGSDVYWDGLSVDPVDIVVIATMDTQIVGFVLLRDNYGCSALGCNKQQYRNCLYIELLCSKGYGSHLVDYVKTLAIVEKKSMLYLSAVLRAVSYYSQRHKFHVSTGRDQVLLLETEIQELHVISTQIDQIEKRREELMHSRQKNRANMAEITAERKLLNSRMRLHRSRKIVLLEQFKSCSTYHLKYPMRIVGIEDIEDEGIFMSFRCPEICDPGSFY